MWLPCKTNFAGFNIPADIKKMYKVASNLHDDVMGQLIYGVKLV